MVGHFVEVCRRSLKVIVGKSKMMMLSGEEGLECEVCMDGMQLEHVSEFKYLGCVLDESDTDETKCRRKVVREVLLGLWLKLGVCSLSELGSCMSHCLYLFVGSVVRQRCGRSRRGLVLRLNIWTTSEV